MKQKNSSLMIMIAVVLLFGGILFYNKFSESNKKSPQLPPVAVSEASNKTLNVTEICNLVFDHFKNTAFEEKPKIPQLPSLFRVGEALISGNGIVGDNKVTVMCEKNTDNKSNDSVTISGKIKIASLSQGVDVARSIFIIKTLPKELLGTINPNFDKATGSLNENSYPDWIQLGSGQLDFRIMTIPSGDGSFELNINETIKF